MRSLRTLAVLGVSVGLLVPRAAWADGAASTRNIILGGAAAAAGTLLIINHNKKVHERYAEDDRRQAALAAQRDDARSAYYSEKEAYEHEAAINAELEKEVAIQHRVVVKLQRQLAASKKQNAAQKTAMAPGVSYGWGHL